MRFFKGRELKQREEKPQGCEKSLACAGALCQLVTEFLRANLVVILWKISKGKPLPAASSCCCALELSKTYQEPETPGRHPRFSWRSQPFVLVKFP
jgi:hypothetical protein